MSRTAVFCICKSRNQAERIIERLIAADFLSGDISVLMPETESLHDIGHVKATKAPEGTAAGAATGGVAGGVLGLLAGIGALAIPGVGPFIAAGPIMAALSGAALGAATGGVVGGLIGLGMPEIEAQLYDGKLKTGNYLVAVHAYDDDEVERAKEIYESENAADICTTSAGRIPENRQANPEESMEAHMSTHPPSRS